MSSLSLLDVAVEERKEELGEKAVTFVFKKEDHAKILLDNLRDMQAGNEGILTDVNLISRRKDSEEKFHSMLLAASSPNVKDLLMARSVKDSARAILLDGLTKETLRCLRKFIYKCEFTIDEDTLQDLHNFAVQFEIDALAAKCEELQDHQGRIKVVPDDHGDVLLELLNMFFEKELTTTTIEDYQGKIQLAVHGPLVAAVSPALQDIILQGCTSQGRHPIRLGIHANVLRDFIGYLYSAKVTLQRENAVGLLRAACTYQIPALSQVCCEWLIAKLDTYDVVGILCLVRELDSEHTAELERRTKKIIITNFSSLSAEHGINALGHEDLMEIIQDEDLEIEDEEHVLHVVMKWLEFDEKNRLPHLSRLLACVRLEQTSLDFLDTIQQDPRIGRSPECLEVIEEARHRLADQGHSMSHSSSHDDEGFQGSEESYDGDSWHEDPREELEGLPTASYNGEDFEDSNLRESDHIDDCYSCYTGDSYNSSPREDEHDDSYLHDRYDSSPPDSYSHGYSDDEEASCLSGPKRKDGQPDMRFKVNRRIFCKSGKNKDDSRDLRLREHRREFPGLVKKNGEPDMRYKVNKELFGALRKTSASISTNVPAKVHPVKKDGTRDMRYRNNRTALCGSSDVSSSACSVVTGTLTGGTKSSLGPSLAKVYTEGPLKKNGAPDMRYAVNKQRFGNLPAATTSSRGPLKKDGKPDMRYAANRQSHHPPQSRSQAQGPLKKDGTPDMRYKANRR